MEPTKYAIPVATVLIAAGTYIGTITAVADDTQKIEDRLRMVEVEQAEQGAETVRLTEALKRLDRLENMVQKNADQLSNLTGNMARVCEATGARCSD